jgi:hypothetical protein
LIVTATDLAAGRPTAFFAFAGPLAETNSTRFTANEPWSVVLDEGNYVSASGPANAKKAVGRPAARSVAVTINVFSRAEKSRCRLR